MVLFVLEALWISVSGAFSMAFDENTHLGIIRLYSNKVLPFWNGQPTTADSLGAVARDPSYLYHYLISFPFRLFAHFFSSEMAQVIFLRFISIGIFIWAILLFRRVLSRTGISKALLNVIIALFILTPVVPFLAAQINYDNLMFLAVAASLLLTQQFNETLNQKRRIDIKKLVLLLGICLFGSLIKYAFLPVFIGIVIYLIIVVIVFIRAQKGSKIWRDLKKQITALSKVQAVLLIIFMLVSGGLFLERYAVNTVRYRTPTPECDQVLNIERCLNYSPWRRNYLTYQDKQKGLLKPLSKNPINYSISMWGKRITNELFFTVDGTSSNYMTRDPLRITRVLSVLTLIFGLGFFLRWQREIRKDRELPFR